jgi:hypothetical protein
MELARPEPIWEDVTKADLKEIWKYITPSDSIH